jgi:hypothetical protein
MSIKSKFEFSINCYKELVDLISEVLPTGHKMPKDMYQWSSHPPHRTSAGGKL